MTKTVTLKEFKESPLSLVESVSGTDEILRVDGGDGVVFYPLSEQGYVQMRRALNAHFAHGTMRKPPVELQKFIDGTENEEGKT
jgi:hypothetical protein